MAPQNNDRVTSVAANKPFGMQAHLDHRRRWRRQRELSQAGLLVFASYLCSPILAGAATEQKAEKKCSDFTPIQSFFNFFSEKRACEQSPAKRDRKAGRKKSNRFNVGVTHEWSTLLFHRISQCQTIRSKNLRSFFFFFLVFSNFSAIPK